MYRWYPTMVLHYKIIMLKLYRPSLHIYNIYLFLYYWYVQYVFSNSCSCICLFHCIKVLILCLSSWAVWLIGFWNKTISIISSVNCYNVSRMFADPRVTRTSWFTRRPCYTKQPVNKSTWLTLRASTTSLGLTIRLHGPLIGAINWWVPRYDIVEK